MRRSTPATLALIIYDMQAGIVSQIADAERVLANVLTLRAAARSRGVRTVFTRHYFMPSELAGVFQLRQAKIWQGKDHAAETRPLIAHSSSGFELVEGLEPEAHRLRPFPDASWGAASQRRDRRRLRLPR